MSNRGGEADALDNGNLYDTPGMEERADDGDDMKVCSIFWYTIATIACWLMLVIPTDVNEWWTPITVINV